MTSAERAVNIVTLLDVREELLKKGAIQAVINEINDAVREERERCAKIAESMYPLDEGAEIADKIRQGEKE